MRVSSLKFQVASFAERKPGALALHPVFRDFTYRTCRTYKTYQLAEFSQKGV